jgi:hypothetical protein
MFIPLLKVDAAQRLVYGSFDETPDRAREICDYATAKTAFQEWSEGMHKASGGKSYGNIRGQHNPKIAAGLLKSIEFDDDAKRIDFCAKIVDDQEWLKVEEGVYTGFSPGGSYAKRWLDGAYHRYTPKVGELSIVDVPCNPNAGFMLTKADGSEEEVQFVIGKAYEPGNDATKARALEMAKAANPDADEGALKNLQKNYVGKARADLIAEKAEAELIKAAGGPDEDDHTGEGPVESDAETVDRAAALDAALTKAGEVLNTEEQPATRLATMAAAVSGVALVKAATDLPFMLPTADAVALIGADLAKSLAAVAMIDAKTKPLAKGMYSITDVACSLNSFSWIAQDVCCEERFEGDTGSPLPQQAIDIVNALKAFLIALIEEEVSEMLERTKSDLADVIDVVIVEEDDTVVMELANKIIDLVKADEAIMAKAGARNSRADSTRIQAIHDNATELGASCPDASADKALKLEEENGRLTKSIDGALPAIDKLTETVEGLKKSNADLAAQVEKLSGEPVMKKGKAFSIDKEEDTGGDLNKTLEPEPGSIESILVLPAGPERQRALDNYAVQARNTSRNPA